MADERPTRGSFSWRAWLRGLLPRRAGGDVIVGEVGEGARDVIIGKNIIKVGTVVIPTLPTAALLLAVAAAVAFTLWLELVPGRMPINVDSFNVAVAEFGQVDAQGRTVESEDGRRLSEWVFRQLQSEYGELPTGEPIVWHDSMGWLEKRAAIGRVEGDTPEARAQAAAELAERLNAHIVIYGNLDAQGNVATFTPEFYVAEVRQEADEVVGPHQLGAPVEMRLPLDPNDPRTNEYLRSRLGSRADALVWFTRALILDLSGQHEAAYEVLRQAESVLTDWQEEEGKEILYYFLGREALFLSQQDSAWLEPAEAAFLRSLEINPAYARAHIGLGGVYYQRAQFLAPEERLSAPFLDQAIAEYAQAVEAGPEASGGQVALKGRLSLGTAYRLLGEAHLFAGDLEAAAEAFARAVADLEAALPQVDPEDHRLLAQAQLGLGAAYHQWGHTRLLLGDTDAAQDLFTRAEAAYTACIQQAEAEFYDTFLQDLRQENCEPYRQAVEQALQDLGGGP